MTVRYSVNVGSFCLKIPRLWLYVKHHGVGVYLGCAPSFSGAAGCNSDDNNLAVINIKMSCVRVVKVN